MKLENYLNVHNVLSKQNHQNTEKEHGFLCTSHSKAE